MTIISQVEGKCKGINMNFSYLRRLCFYVRMTVDVYKRQEDWGVEFLVESAEDVQITVQLEDDTEYEVFVDDVAVGGMKTNMSGKLNCSVELNEGVTAKVKIVKR